MMQLRCSLFIFIFLLFGLVKLSFAGSYICVPKEQAKKMIVELEQKRIMKQEIKKYEELNKILIEQNKLLKKQMELLKEQVELIQSKSEFYEKMLAEKEKELNREKMHNFLRQVETFGVGTATGILIGIIITM